MSRIRVEVRRGLNLELFRKWIVQLFIYLHLNVLPTAGLAIPTSLQVLDLKRNRLSLTNEGEILQSFDLFWSIFHYPIDCLV